MSSEVSLKQQLYVVFVPCLLLGRYLSLSAQQDTLYILYDPGAALHGTEQASSRATVAPTILDHARKEETQEKREASPSRALEKQASSVAVQALDPATLGPSWPWVALTGLSLVAGLIFILLESHLSVQAVHVHQ